MDIDELFLDGDDDFLFHLAAHFLSDDGSGVKVDQLAQRGHDAVFHQAFDHLGAGFLHPAGQLTHRDLIGDLDLDGRFFGNLQLQAAHPFGLVLLALVGEGHVAPALIAVAELFLAALLLHPLGTLAAQSLQALVVLGQVHVAALAGVHDLLLGNPGGGLLHGSGGLLRVSGLLGRRIGILADFRSLSGLLFRRRSALVSVGRSVRLGGSRLRLIRVCKDGLNAGNLIVLCQVIKDHRQLVIVQDLHVVFRSRHIFGQNFCNGLGGQTEVFGHLMDSIFFHTQ